MKSLNVIFRFQMTIDKLIMKALNFIFRFQMTIDKFKILFEKKNRNALLFLE